MRKQTVSYVPLSLKMHMFNNESTNVKKFVKILCDILSVCPTLLLKIRHIALSHKLITTEDVKHLNRNIQFII